MLVNNPCTIDSRAIKEAETLAGSGYRVRVICRNDGSAPKSERVNDVEYERISRLRPLALLASVAGKVFGGRVHEESPGGDNVERAAEPPGEGGVAWLHPLLRFAKRTIGKHFSEVYIHWEFAHATRQAILRFTPSVIHANDLATLPAGAGAAQALGGSLIYDVRDLAVEEYPDHPVGIMLWRRIQERRLIRRADHVLVPSEGFVDYLTGRYRIARPTILYNSPRIGPDRSPDGGLRETLGLSPDTPLVAFTGALRFDRGLTEIFQALALCPGFHFVRIGPSTEDLQRATLDLARELGITKRVHFLPPVPGNAVPGFIAGADLSVIANQNLSLNYDLALPNKLFEAVLAGLPLAVGRLSEISRFVREHGVGLVMDETDPGDIAEKIQAVYDRRAELAPAPDRLEELIAHFGWDAQGVALTAVYRNLTKEIA